MTHRGSRGIALLFHDHGSRRGWGASVMPRPLFTPRKDPAPIVQEAGWAPGPVWTGAENLAPTKIQSLDCPARRQSLYQPHYPAHSNSYMFTQTPSFVKMQVLREVMLCCCVSSVPCVEGSHILHAGVLNPKQKDVTILWNVTKR
jgi:hypothetical protein